MDDAPSVSFSKQAHRCTHPETDWAAGALGVPLSRRKPWQKAKSPLTVMLKSRDSRSIGPSHVSNHAFSSWESIPVWESGGARLYTAASRVYCAAAQLCLCCEAPCGHSLRIARMAVSPFEAWSFNVAVEKMFFLPVWVQ